MKRDHSVRYLILFAALATSLLISSAPVFAQVPPSPPLVSPAHDSDQVGQNVTYQWQLVSGAATYWLEVIYVLNDITYYHYNRDVGFTNNLTVTNHQENDRVYYWRVYAGNNYGWSASSQWSFTNRPTGLPGKPVLKSPANDATVDGDQILFEWYVNYRDADFRLEVAYDSNFTFIFGSEWQGGPYEGAPVWNFPDNGETFYWRVRARNSLGEGLWSDAWSVVNGPTSAPAQPTLVSPGNGSNVGGTDVRFTWNIAARAAEYLLQIADDSNFTVNLYDEWLENYTYQDIIGFLDIGEIQYWRVQARNSKGSSAFSTTRQFTNGPSAVPDKPTLYLPEDNSTVRGTTISFEWNYTNRATNYRIQIARDALFTNIFHDEWLGDADLYADVTGFMDDNQRYYWRVQASNSRGPGAYSSARSFYNGQCAPQVGMGSGLLSPQNHIDTCYDSSTLMYSLQDISRRASTPADHSHSGRMSAGASIDTTLQPSGSTPPMTHPDNTWDLSGQLSGVDAHVYAGKSYDHFNLLLALNSFDDLGSTMTSRVGFPSGLGALTPNAFWDDIDASVSFTTQVGPFLPFSSALDVVGHEWGHAVTARASARAVVTDPWNPGILTAGLFYAYESGALNEAFSDWLGTAVEHSYDETNWTMGEGVLILRDLQDPRNPSLAGVLLADGQTYDLRQPDTYNGVGYVMPTGCTPPAQDNCGVHTNSGVPNKMFYLLSAGGTHNDVQVQGIGLPAAMAIAYKANMELWLHDATFQDALAGMLESAVLLHPQDLNFAYQVQNAWDAVGVGMVAIINATASPTEGGTTTGGGTSYWGTSATVMATASPGYRFVNWTENEMEVSTDASYTFVVNGNRTLTANFALVDPTISISPTSHDFGNYLIGEMSPPHTLMISNAGEEALVIATVLVIGDDYADFVMNVDDCSGRALSQNQTCSLEITFSPLSAGIKQASISIPSNDANTPFLEVPLSGTAAEPPTFTITASAEPGGLITPFGSIDVTLGESQTFTIEANTGFSILDVTVDGVSESDNLIYTIPDVEATYTFDNVDADHTITATYSLNTYTITASAGVGGTISPSGAVEVLFAESQAFTIAADTGYTILDVTVDGVSEGSISTYTFDNVDADHTIAATFSLKTYTITATADGNGSISPSGSVIVTHGNDQTFTITPDAGNSIADVLVDGTSVGNSVDYTFLNVTADHSIEARFSTTLTVTKSGTGKGRVTSNPAGIDCQADCTGSSASYDYGTVVKLTATSDLLSDFTGWSGGGCGGTGTCTITMNTSTTITADFTFRTHTITASTGGGGSISPSGPVIVNRGSDQTFTITPDAGNSIADVLVDGTSVGNSGDYTFLNVTADHSIEARFSTTLTVTKTGTGSARITSDPVGISCGRRCTESTADFDYGTVVTLTVTRLESDIFNGWSGGGCAGTGPCTVTMNASMTITASFDETRPPITRANPRGGTYDTAQVVTLTCSDKGAGCDQIYYTTDDSTPTTSSNIYSGPILIAITTTLKFFATDLLGNIENVNTQIYTIATGVTLTPTLASPQTIGASMTFIANGSGGSGVYEYQFFLKLDTDTAWTTVKDYSTSYTWSWNTIGYEAGLYNVRVYVRNVGSTATFEASDSLDYTLEVAPDTGGGGGGGGGGGRRRGRGGEIER